MAGFVFYFKGISGLLYSIEILKILKENSVVLGYEKFIFFRSEKEFRAF